jgi:hypothetical protein
LEEIIQKLQNSQNITFVMLLIVVI